MRRRKPIAKAIDSIFFDNFSNLPDTQVTEVYDIGLSFIGYHDLTFSNRTLTASGVSIGTPAADRLVVVALGTICGDSSVDIDPDVNFLSMTIGGIPAALHVGDPSDQVAAVFSALVPSGATADIVVTANQSPLYAIERWDSAAATIGVWTLFASSGIPADTGSTLDVTDQSVSVSVRNAFGSISWANATERYESILTAQRTSGADRKDAVADTIAILGSGVCFPNGALTNDAVKLVVSGGNNADAGDTISSITVTAVDHEGNVDTSRTDTILVNEHWTDPSDFPNGILSGTLSKALVNGTITFDDLSISVSGEHDLIFSTSAFGSAVLTLDIQPTYVGAQVDGSLCNGIETGTTSSSTITFSALDLGSAAADRLILALIRLDQNRTVSSVDIGGVSATEIVSGGALFGSNHYFGIWMAAVPTGVTGDVVVTFASGDANVAVSLFRIADANATPVESWNTNGIHDTTIPDGGYVIIFHEYTPGAAWRYTGGAKSNGRAPALAWGNTIAGRYTAFGRVQKEESAYRFCSSNSWRYLGMIFEPV